MRISHQLPSDERIVETMLQLARASKSDRMIVAGPISSEIFIELHRRGYPRATTTKLSRIPCGQYDVGLVAWPEHSIKSLEPTLTSLLHFLSTTGVLVIWTNAQQSMPSRELRLLLQRLGFRVEAGAHCEEGVAVSARRLELMPAARAA
jgi:hypothetical protein